jgi:hypothetical protein
MAAARRLSSLALVASVAAALAAGGAGADGSGGPTVVFAAPSDGAVYYQGQVVQAGYGCVAGDSGYPPMSCVGDVALGDPVDTSTSGDHAFTVRTADPFGATTTATVHYTVVDVVPPAVTMVAPADGAVYEVGAPVSVSYSCDDPGGSGVVACLGTQPTGTPLPTGEPGTFSFDVQAFDAAGNRSATHVTYTVADSTPPTVSVASPAAATGDRLPTFVLGQVVRADYSCADNGRLAFCAGPVASGAPLDTSSVGVHAFTVTAQDSWHNVTSVSRPYAVVYAFDGFSTPLAPWPTFASTKAGDVVPAKFSLGGDRGMAVVSDVAWRSLACDGGSAGVATPGRATLAYNASTGRYTLRVPTDASWAGTCRELDVTLDDGTVHVAALRFAK